MKKNFHVMMFFMVSISLFGISCKTAVGPQIGDDGFRTDGLNFNLTGAKAIGAADMSASRAIKGLGDYRSIKSAMSRTGQDEYGLVKVLEDGSVEMVMDLPDNVWMPRVMFIAKSPVEGSKDLFVAFENSINYWDQTTQQSVELGSFLHIREDGSYKSIIDKTNGRVKNYSWYGNDSYKPVSFDGEGNIYYVFETWGSSSSSNQLFVYNPATGGNKAITPALSGTYFNNFEVSADGQRLFVQGERQAGGSRSSFFRMYPISNVEMPVTVYYSSNSNTWVRGYKVSPASATTQNVILNGYNIRGINGLLRANVISDSTLSYEPLFDSGSNNNQWFQPEYQEWYSEWEAKTYYNGFFDRFNVYDIYLVMTDKTDFYYLRLQDYLYNYENSSSPYVSKNPVASDYNSQGYTYMTISQNGFGFAADSEDKTSLISSTEETSVKALYDAVKSGAKAVMFVRRWENNKEVVKKFDVSIDLCDQIIAHKGDSNYSTMYQWNTHWFKNQDRAQGLDSAAILQYAGKYFVDDVLFKYLINDAGDASFSVFEAKEYYLQSEIYGSGIDYSSTFFVDNYFVKKNDIATKALTFDKYKQQNNLQWLNFQNVSALHYDSTGACWAIIGGSMWGGSSSTVRPVKILKPDGSKTLELVSALNGTTYNPVSFLVSGNSMFFRDGLLDADGFESGYHKLYKVDLTESDPAPVDVLASLGADNGRLEIVSFSVSGNILYFTGVKGSGVIGGKIDLTTLAYTPLSDEYLLRNIEVY